MLKYEEEIIREIPAEDSTAHEEKMMLYEEIKKRRPLTIVETGTHRGLTTLYMAHAVLENGQGVIHTADPFEWGAKGNFRKFPELEALIRFNDRRGSQMIQDLTEIDFAFIDGYHEKVQVLEELNVLLPRLTEGAVVFFHDTNGSNIHCDVPGAIDELGLQVEYIKTTNGLAKYVHGGNSDNKTKRTRVSKKRADKTDASAA